LLKFCRLFPIITEAKNSKTGIELAGCDTFQEVDWGNIIQSFKEVGYLQFSYPRNPEIGPRSYSKQNRYESRFTAIFLNQTTRPDYYK